MGNLVLGFDDSAGSRAALHAAIDVAKAMGDRIVVTFGYRAPGPADEQNAADAAVREVGERVTRHALAAIEGEGVDHELALLPMSGVDALIQAADEHNARAIVVGTYGESPLKGAILGSTPHKLLHLSKRPVLVVPAQPPR
jgi:nucleotide-binding universal stress UspA family protein